MTKGHFVVLIFELSVVLFGAWYIYQLNKKEHK